MLRKQIKKLLSLSSSRKYHTLNWIELSKNNVLSNVDLVQNLHPDFGMMPVLKGNAYGHGLTQMATILNQADCAFVAVDGYFEAAKIRDITRHHILVLGYIKPENFSLLDTKKCSFVVQDIEALRAFGRLGKPVKIHLELNTGMNRLGLSESELLPYLETFKDFPNLHLEAVMTHLADADNPADSSFTENQVKQFDQLVKKIRGEGWAPKYIHIAHTAGSAKATSKYANALRLGIGLYGLNPLRTSDNHYQELVGLSPVLELKSTVIKIVHLKTGDKVSYGGTFTAPQAMDIGVLPLGYYEGVPRELSNTGSVSFDGQQLPIVGRVCMNHTMIDLRGADIKVGDEVTIISQDRSQPNSIDRLCAEHNLFNYSFATNLSSTIRRVII